MAPNIASQAEEQLIHLVRLAWDLRTLGVSTSLVLLPGEFPALDVMQPSGRPLRVEMIRRPHGWVFTWRPSWSSLWRRAEWAWALDEDAATKVKAAVNP